MIGKDSEELKKELRGLHDWVEKKEAFVQKLRGLAHYSHQYKRSLLQSAYGRIMMAKEYEPKIKLESKIVLIKGIPHPKARKLPEDYNLSKFSNQAVKIFNIEADHALVPNDSRVTNLVNRLLDPQILEEFKNKNLCEIYFADPSKQF